MLESHRLAILIKKVIGSIILFSIPDQVKALSNMKWCDTKSLVEVVPTSKRREPPVSPGESRSLNKERL